MFEFVNVVVVQAFLPSGGRYLSCEALMRKLREALQRANSNMLRNADRRRRAARASGKYSSGTRPLSSDDDCYM